MAGYMVRVEVPEGEVQEIFQRLEKAQEEIYGCYSKLREIGDLTVVPKGKNKGKKKKGNPFIVDRNLL